MWVFAPTLERDLLAYVGGVMDTLDGSHGSEFTYLPIVYQDDCQIVLGDVHHVRSGEMKYEMQLSFLDAADDSGERELPNNPLQGTGSAGR
jgi:hypothetical protein